MKQLFIIVFFLFGVGSTNCNKENKPELRSILALQKSSSSNFAKNILVGQSSSNTNEFGNKVTIQIEMKNAPSEKVDICISSQDTTKGGTILVSGTVKEDASKCSLSATYLEFTIENWTTAQTFQVTGSRGTAGVSGNTDYKIQFDVISNDVAYNKYALADISLTNLDIDITGAYFVRTNISGLTGSIQLQNNSVENLTLTENGLNNFPTTITNGSGYSVSIQTQPTGQVCSISNLPYGTSVTNLTINIICVDGFLFNGTLLASASAPTLNQAFTGLVTIAGSFPPTVLAGNNDGAGLAARFDNPIAITSDGTNIYVADLSNNAIRKITIGTNTVTTLATVASFPHGVATDGVNVYVSSYGTNTIQKVVISTGTVTTLAGTGVGGDAVGAGTSAQFQDPTYLTTDGINLFVVDRGNGKVKQIVLSTGIVSSLITGLISPNGIATDGTNLYIAETGNHRIIKYIIATTAQSVIAGTGLAGNSDNATGTLAQFNEPYGITMDGSYLYTLEGNGKNLKKILLSFPNSVTTILSQNNGYTDGVIGVTQFCNTGINCDSSITFDGSYLYISDRFNNSIRKLYY